MKGQGPIYMQQMCPVQYTYSIHGKHELHHAMKKKALLNLLPILYVVCNNTEQCKSAQTTQTTKCKTFR